MRDLFQALRKEVLALDPVVSEEFLKYYVAYKAETNFVDVIPQARRLRLEYTWVINVRHASACRRGSQTLKQCYYWRRTLSILNLHDKLKHIGH